MKYDFTTVLDRAGKDSIAADVIPMNASVLPGFDKIPMWVADMSFPTAPPILKAMAERLENPSFGYFMESDEYFDSIISWQQRQNGVEGLSKAHIGYENGVLGGVSSAVQALSAPGDKVLIHSPTYIGFTHTLNDIGRTIVHSPLKRDEQGIWRMDYEDMAAKIRDNGIHLAIFCSPHNPCGRVWERWELEKAMEVYRDNDCFVISDEIWSDIIMPGHKHIPTQSVSDDARRRTVAFYAPSKTFSLAGLVGSYHIVYDRYLRDRLERQSAMSHYNACNVMSMHALIGAYSPEGEEWAEEMCSVVDDNLRFACGYLTDHAPEISFMRPQGTYMLYLDLGQYCENRGVSVHDVLRRGVEHGVIWQNGEPFMMENTIRMNFALPRHRAVEAMERLGKYVF